MLYFKYLQLKDDEYFTDSLKPFEGHTINVQNIHIWFKLIRNVDRCSVLYDS